MGSMVNPMIWLLYPWEIATAPIVQKAGWRTRVDWCEEGKISLPTGVQNPKPSIL
jgi:hypothetical protein